MIVFAPKWEGTLTAIERDSHGCSRMLEASTQGRWRILAEDGKVLAHGQSDCLDNAKLEAEHAFTSMR